jgi:hypothetical protein
MTTRDPIHVRAACALSCCQRTAEEWERIRLAVARDLAGYDGHPPAPRLTAAEVVEVITQRGGDTNR